MTNIDLDELEAKAAAATGGPWHWAGNTDTGEPYLATWIKGAGRCQVLSVGHQDRSLESREAEQMRDDLLDCGYDDAETETMVEDWATDMHGQPRRDARLEFMTDLMTVRARDLAIFEVAPSATTRDDPKVYRADVVGIRHPDAEFIAAAHPAVMLALITRLREVEAALAVFEQAHTPTDDERDGMAKAMCAIETRSKAASLEEVQAGIQRWTRHRYEAERLIEELADAGFEVRRTVQGEPTDAEVEAAGAILYANWESFDFNDPTNDWERGIYDLVRAALRAAAAVREEGQGHG